MHFGYVDGIAQPRIAGALGKQPAPDMQPEMPTGDLLLGRDYSNSFGGNFAGSLPPALADNATYGAFRILRPGRRRASRACCASWGRRPRRGPRARSRPS